MPYVPIDKRHDWFLALEALSPVIAGLRLRAQVSNDDYSDTAPKPNRQAYNLASHPPHNKFLARTIEGLAANGVPAATLEKALIDLTGRNTYGAFCELSAYGWLLDRGIPFEVQLSLTGADILNPNGADIDGRIIAGGPGILFDVKAFGFTQLLIDRLVERLSKDIPGQFIAPTGSWDASIDDLEDLLGKGYAALKADLIAKRHIRRHGIDFALRPPAKVQNLVRTSDPYELAENNASYAFAYAKQFARNEPFFLFFVVHPWFSGTWMDVDFGGWIDSFTRAFARRTFLQFRHDASPVLGVTKAQAAGLLSGVGFIHTWQDNAPADDKRPMRLFINPLAVNPVSDLTLDHMRIDHAHDIMVTRFTYDVY